MTGGVKVELYAKMHFRDQDAVANPGSEAHPIKSVCAVMNAVEARVGRRCQCFGSVMNACKRLPRLVLVIFLMCSCSVSVGSLEEVRVRLAELMDFHLLFGY